MKTIYLIRHGQISFPDEKRCISETDYPLDSFGLYQAERLREWADKLELDAVFSSPLGRCTQTAGVIAGGRLPVRICDGLREMSVGEWENMTFSEIREKYPKLYAKRRIRLGTTPPPGGESFKTAGKRFVSCMDAILSETQGDVAIIAHGGVISAALCLLTGQNPNKAMAIRQPYGGITTLRDEGNGAYSVISIGEKPERFPSAFEMEYLLMKHETPPEVQAHCKAVASVAKSLAGQVSGAEINIGLLQSACELHDISKGSGPHHAKLGAQSLDREGYPDIAELIAVHHDLPADAGTEACLLYLADKLVLGTRYVSFKERFEASKERCETLEAQEAWTRRLRDAQMIIERYHLNIRS